MEMSITMAMACLMIVIALYKIFYKGNSVNKKRLEEDELENLLKKGIRDYHDINMSIAQIKDRDLVSIGGELQTKSDVILSYLQKHRQDLPAARKFIEYYQDRAALLLRKCITIEKAGVSNEEIIKIVNDTKEVLINFYKAYDLQLEKIMNSQLIDISAELTVAKQVLDSDGVEKSDHIQCIKKQAENEVANEMETKNSFPKWMTSKNIGGAVLTVLGMVGIYKLLNSKGKNNNDNE